MENYGTQGGEIITYYASCGHTSGQRPFYVHSDLSTCAMQPSCHFIIPSVYFPCQGCVDGDSVPLTDIALEQMSNSMNSLIAEENAFRLAVSTRNEPEEERLCSTPSQLLGLPEARQIHNLLYQLENVLGFGFLLERHDVDFLGRQQRLCKAICNMPFSLIEEFHLEERLHHAEALQEYFQNTLLYGRFAPQENRRQLQGELEEIATAMDPQIQALQEMFGDTAADNPEISTRWVDLCQSYALVLIQFNRIVAGVNLNQEADRNLEVWARNDQVIQDEQGRRLAAVQSLVQSCRVEDVTDIDPDCPICRENMQQPALEQEFATRLACGHVFGSACLARWLCENTSCPSCRREYRRLL